MENFQDIINYIIQNESKKTVGMVCKRIELALEQSEVKNSLNDKEISNLKLQIKEVIYEQYRSMKDFLCTGKILFEFGKETKKEK
jgi:hypothetical protein